ncbi:MAG: haloacid dehalogenase-like hydrolase [Candidatus Gracilibacteria bacterium]|nr:haloacid dehalogenase-like hydrolase [Candidatus Gracilibacteria bacterium]
MSHTIHPIEYPQKYSHSMSFLTPNPTLLESKLSRFTPETTRVVTDFDSTLTADNGKTSWSLFADSGLMPESYVVRRQVLKDRYYPYEIDLSLSETERSGYMRDWWIGHLELLVEYGLHKDILEQVVNHEMKIRTGMDSMLQELEELSIPVLVLSAGITQSIESVLRNQNLLFQEISIASNSLIFNAEGICQGIDTKQIIHVCNKDEWDASENVQETFKARTNILLFGDSLDDIKMIRNEERDSTIAVGFCTSNRVHQREKFLDTFDIVVESNTGDGGVGKFLLERIKS